MGKSLILEMVNIPPIKNGDDWGMVCHCFTHITWHTLFFFLQESPDCGAAGEVRDCHKSSFINESAELRLLCSDEGWDRKGSGDRTDESARLMMASCLINGLRIAKSQAY